MVRQMAGQVAGTTLSSRALCPGSIYRLALTRADAWIPVTSTGMTPVDLRRPPKLLARERDAHG